MIIKRLTDNEIRAYQQWEKSAATRTGQTRYLNYVPTGPVFRVRDQDVPALAPDISYAVNADNRLTVSNQALDSDRDNRDLVLSGNFSEAEVRDILARVDGQRTTADIVSRLSGHHDASRIHELLNQLLGHTVTLPDTINSLKQLISNDEIVRIPLRSPYALLREYWENQAAIRQHLSRLPAALETGNSFKAYLSELHVLATVGASGENYYGGGGGIATTPGQYRTVAVETEVSDQMVEFVSRELANMGYNYPTRADKTLKSRRDRVVGYSLNSARKHHHHYDGIDDLDEKLEELRDSLRLAQQGLSAGDAGNAVKQLACFHWLFSHVHPFANINNSIAMNIVNSYLLAMKIGYMPHLFLDYFAQRTGCDLYEDVFLKYLNKFCIPDDSRSAPNKLKVIANYYRRFSNTAGAA